MRLTKALQTPICAMCLLITAISCIASPGKAAQLRANEQTFASVLLSAGAGDEVLLSPGQYGVLTLSDAQHFEGLPLTIRSLDPEDPAVFTVISAHGARGIILEDLVFKHQYDPSKAGEKIVASSVKNSRDITLRRNLFHGDVATGTGTTVDGYGSGIGLRYRHVSGIVIEDCEFYQWGRGLIVYQSNDIELRASEFHGIRSDGADFAQVQNVLIEGNHFHDFRRHPESGDHPDMIQFWTNYTFDPTVNVLIRNNILNAGLGAWTQSIFMRNELVDSQGAGPEAFYRDIEISGNVIINAHLHGITVGETDGLVITNNTLLRNYFTPVQKGRTAFTSPSIRLADRSLGVKVTDNIVAKIAFEEEKPGWEISGNIVPHSGGARDDTHIHNLFIAAREGLPVNLAPFIYHPEGIAAGGAIGSPLLLMGPAFAKTVLARSYQDPSYINRVTLDAGLTPGGAGRDVTWRFSGGDKAHGPRVDYVFETGQPASATAYLEGYDPFTLVFFAGGPQALSLQDGQITYFDQGQSGSVEGIPFDTERGGGRFITVSKGGENPSLPRSVIARFFGSHGFELDLRLRATAPGEVLRIHTNIIAGISARGQVSFSLNTAETPKPVYIATGPLGIHDGEWHDVSLRYDSAAEEMSILVDGVQQARGTASGKIRPMEFWGLSFGNPFDGSSFEGDIQTLNLRVDSNAILRK